MLTKTRLQSIARLIDPPAAIGWHQSVGFRPRFHPPHSFCSGIDHQKNPRIVKLF
jgi:hypothetical protein